MSKMSRRTFLKAAAGSALAAGPGGKVVDRLIPYVVPPRDTSPGRWSLYATTCRECPAGCGLHLRHRDGRVTKAEGNPGHPVNRGGLCPRGQSSVQGLYDPDRVTAVLHREGSAVRRPGWPEAVSAIGRALRGARGRVALVSDLQTGALAEVMEAFVAAFGSDRLLVHEPFAYEPLRAAHGAVFGLPVIPDYRIEACDVVVSFAADFLESWISPVSYARRFGDFHAPRDGRIGRMIYVGPRLSMTAANADEVLLVPPGAEGRVALAMLRTMVERGLVREALRATREEVAALPGGREAVPGVPEERIAALAETFARAGRSVALAGPVGASGSSAAETAIAAALLNRAAGSPGRTLDFSRPHALGRTATEEQTRAFLSGLSPEDVLIVCGANPAYTRAGAWRDIRRAGTVVSLAVMADETAELATWVLPVDSPLEAWGDYEPVAGVHGLMQPTMARLHDSRSAGDVLIALAKAAGRPLSRAGSARPADSFAAWLRLRWDDLGRRLSPGSSRDAFWDRALRAGGFFEASRPSPPLKARPFPRLPARAPDAGAIRLWAWPSIMLFDGRVANRGWLQEAPDPVTTVTWGSWVDVHPALATRLGLHAGDVVALTTESGRVEAPLRVTDEVADNVAAIPFGQGHTALGRNAAGRGANPFLLLGGAGGPSPFPLVTVRGTGRREEPARTTATRDQHGRSILQWVPLSRIGRAAGPEEGEAPIMPLPEGYDPARDMYPARRYKEHRWAMAIDLQRCIGCGACAVACHAENNVPVVGRKQVVLEREMAWLRVVPYRHPERPLGLGWLPMLCQHCDAAPCEPVCPVFASVHNEEGLNAQIFNRCIGTRYCSHNCPYKVRRFNWADPRWDGPLDLQLNPEVTARRRGVMEKCTFCVQRIREASYRARQEKRRIRDGEVQPACVQSCPTRVFAFGDLLDPASEVSRRFRTDPRRYQVLRELNTKTAVIYLRRIDAGGAG